MVMFRLTSGDIGWLRMCTLVSSINTLPGNTQTYFFCVCFCFWWSDIPFCTLRIIRSRFISQLNINIIWPKFCFLSCPLFRTLCCHLIYPLVSLFRCSLISHFNWYFLTRSIFYVSDPCRKALKIKDWNISFLLYPKRMDDGKAALSLYCY